MQQQPSSILLALGALAALRAYSPHLHHAGCSAKGARVLGAGCRCSHWVHRPLLPIRTTGTLTYQISPHKPHVMQVQLDEQQYPGEEGRAVWDQSLHGPGQREAFEVRRLGSTSTSAKVGACVRAYMCV